MFTVSRTFLFVFGVRPGLPRVLLLDLLRLADVVWLDARFCRGSSWDFLSRRDRLCFFFFSSFSSFSSEELETGEGAEERPDREGLLVALLPLRRASYECPLILHRLQ